MRVKQLFKVVSILLVVMLTFSACGGSSDSQSTQSTASTSAAASSTTAEKIDPMAKYEPAIELSTVLSLNSERKYPSGMTWDNNVWTKAYEEKMGVKLKYLWTVNDKQFDEKLNIAIASDDLPDVMKIPYKFFYKLAKNGKLADLTQVYDKYATDYVKEYFAQSDGYAVKNCTIDGKLYGLAAPQEVNNTFQVLFIRDDWMKKLNLSAPKTAADVVKIADAFATQDPDGNGKNDTAGLGMDKTLYDGGLNIAGFMNMYNAYPRIWVQKNGKLEYGSVQPEMKTALQELANMYKQGAIDKEFSLKGSWDGAYNDGIAGKYGMGFGYYWFQLWYPNDIAKNDKTGKVIWNSYLIPDANGGTAKTIGNAGLSDVTCVNVKCKNPEAAVKLSNLATLLLDGGNLLSAEEVGSPEHMQYSGVKEKDANGKETNIETFFFNYVGMNFAKLHWNLDYGTKVAKAIETKDPSILVGPADYDNAMKYLEGKAPEQYGTYYTYGPNQTFVKVKQILDQKLYQVNEFSGADTETMATNKASLDSKEIEIFTQIIMGAKPIDEFDKWVEYYYQQGGTQITKEVNDWYQSVNSK